LKKDEKRASDHQMEVQRVQAEIEEIKKDSEVETNILEKLKGDLVVLKEQDI
jgi:hypothetical protein